MEKNNNNDQSTVSNKAALENSGLVGARQVVRLYVEYPVQAEEPPKLLKGFEKASLRAGRSTLVDIRVDLDDLKVWDAGEEDWAFANGT